MKEPPFSLQDLTAAEWAHIVVCIVGGLLGLCVGVLLFIPNCLMGGAILRGIQYCLEECAHEQYGNGLPDVDDD
jgi:hypothetical protein